MLGVALVWRAAAIDHFVDRPVADTPTFARNNRDWWYEAEAAQPPAPPSMGQVLASTISRGIRALQPGIAPSGSGPPVLMPAAPTPVPAQAVAVAGSHVTILEPFEARDFIQNDVDKYARNMTKADIRARRVFTLEQYISASAANAMNVALSQADKDRVAADCASADAYLTRRGIRSWAINAQKLARIPWVIAFTSASPPPCSPITDVKNIPLPTYEDGLPHTRGWGPNAANKPSVIFLPTAFLVWNQYVRVETLIHEKIHVYQRFYPQDIAFIMSQPFNDRGQTRWFAEIQKRKDRPEDSNVRSNPDVDEWMYGSCPSAPPNHLPEKQRLAWATSNCIPMGVLYKGTPVTVTDPDGRTMSGVDGPNCITDTDKENTPDRYEHPYELMAYDIGSEYKEYIELMLRRR